MSDDSDKQALLDYLQKDGASPSAGAIADDMLANPDRADAKDFIARAKAYTPTAPAQTEGQWAQGKVQDAIWEGNKTPGADDWYADAAAADAARRPAYDALLAQPAAAATHGNDFMLAAQAGANRLGALMAPQHDPYLAWAQQAQAQHPEFQGDSSVVAPTIQREDLTGGAVPNEEVGEKPGAPDEIEMPDEQVASSPLAQARAHGMTLPEWDAQQASHDAYSQFAAPPTVDQQLAQLGVGSAPMPSLAERNADLAKMTPADQARAVSKMSPEEFISYKANRDGALMQQQAAEQHAANTESQQRAFDAFQGQQAAIAKADADTNQMMTRANALANTKVVAKTAGIGDFIGIVLGGGFSGKDGHNYALDQFNKKVDNDIAIQKDNLANQWQGIGAQKGAIAAELEHHGDLYKAQETYRVAAYQGAINDMQTQLQQYDPAGATAIRGRDGIDQLHAQQQQAIQTYNAANLKQQMEIQKARIEALAEDRQMRAQQATEKHQRAEEGIAWAGAQIAKNKDKREEQAFRTENAPVTPEQIRLENPGLPEAAYPTTVVTRKQLEMHLKSFEQGQKLTDQEAKNAGQATGLVVRNPVTKEPLTTDTVDPKTGAITKTPIQMAKSEEATEINKKLATGQDLVDSLSDARRFLASDPSSFSRAEWAAQSTRAHNAIIKYIEQQGAKPSSREVQAVEPIFGPDFEKYRDRITQRGPALAKIDEIIKIAKRETETDVGTLTGYKGRPGESLLLDTSKPPASAPTSVDAATESLAHDPTKSRTDELSKDDAEYLKFVGSQPEHTAGIGVRDYAGNNPTVKRADDLGIPPSKMKALDSLKTMALDPRTGKAASDAIDEQVKNGETKAIRRYARQIFQELSDESINAIPTTEPSPQD